MSQIKHKIILLASNGNNIGKTSTANNLENYLYNKNKNKFNTEILSFANPIREISEKIYNVMFEGNKSIPFEDIYTQEYKNQPLIKFYTKDNFNAFPTWTNKSIRDLVNLISDGLQKDFGPYIWANYALQCINNKIHYDNEYCEDILFIFDDFRRPLEYEYLLKSLDSSLFDIITIYLDKEGNKSQVNTSYEGQLTNFPFDIKFMFKQDYSNINKLFELIEERL